MGFMFRSGCLSFGPIEPIHKVTLYLNTICWESFFASDQNLLRRESEEKPLRKESNEEVGGLSFAFVAISDRHFSEKVSRNARIHASERFWTTDFSS
ncbi:hypothetical protein AVEN_69740-1 [Araneus ventricosus]|uniref:Uncharacterized protein n=1 Tax=Araneus ventricosus TaxID=182803 RepID=A0A4Y2CWQ1_ARAVE|nr:hypothetical protein AVEN_69740-1 [Araneus ventricosus]